MKKLYTILFASLIFTGANAQSFFEDFEGNPGNMPGWDSSNVSNPLGATNWFAGNTTVFTAYNNAGYLATNYQNTSGTGTISNWMAAPLRWMHDGDMIIFSTRKVDSGATNYPDRMEVRLSTAGAASALPLDETNVGSYSNVLLDINPTYSNTSGSGGGYPYVWKRYVLTLSGLPGGQTGCRFAFRYFVENGGPTGANSDYIGIDSLAYVTTFNSLEENNISSEMVLYPNPAKEKVILEIIGDQLSRERSITITNLLGETVMEFAATEKVTAIDVSSLNSGIYFLTSKGEDGIGTKKLVIE